MGSWTGIGIGNHDVSVEDCIWAILCGKKYGINRENVTHQTPLQLDPIQTMNLFEDIAKALEIKITLRYFAGVPTVADIIRYVETYVVRAE